MIYEFRTYTLTVGSLREVLKRFEDVYEHRKKYSELAAFWYTDIGPLNQIIHAWPYADMAERNRVRAESVKDPNWPPKVHEFIVAQESEIVIPSAFAPEIKPGNAGPIFEMRYYQAKPGGALHEAMKTTEAALPPRLEHSSLTFAGYTEHGSLNKYIHIWPYESYNARAEIRKKVVEMGIWPPKGGAGNWLSQANKIMLPAPFSPIQ